jgi:hypothetical protein
MSSNLIKRAHRNTTRLEVGYGLYPDYRAFASVVAADAFLKEISRAEETGAVMAGNSDY